MSGEVRLGGHAPNVARMQAMGDRVGYLAQEIELFETSVANNIARLSEPNAQAVVAAAQAVGIHEDILRLPQGYETVVPAGAGMVSTGLRQRIGIARALYGQPELVVLDEPTSHLDEAADLAFLQTLKCLKASSQATVIVMTHRTNILGLADRVIRLSHGELTTT
jgi:ABC-type protease/lipase transport system fused ATPase/permease subunit